VEQPTVRPQPTEAAALLLSEAERGRRWRAEMRGFLTGFGLSGVLGAALYMFLTAL
jgi:hypothetical protein